MAKERKKPTKTEIPKVKIDEEFRFRFRRLIEEKCGKEKGNRTEFADFLGIPVSRVHEYCDTDKNPKADFLRLVSEKCNCPIDWLLGMPNSTRSIDTELQAVCKYTGLSEEAVNCLHSLENNMLNYYDKSKCYSFISFVIEEVIQKHIYAEIQDLVSDTESLSKYLDTIFEGDVNAYIEETKKDIEAHRSQFELLDIQNVEVTENDFYQHYDDMIHFKESDIYALKFHLNEFFRKLVDEYTKLNVGKSYDTIEEQFVEAENIIISNGKITEGEEGNG